MVNTIGQTSITMSRIVFFACVRRLYIIFAFSVPVSLHLIMAAKALSNGAVYIVGTFLGKLKTLSPTGEQGSGWGMAVRC